MIQAPPHTWRFGSRICFRGTRTLKCILGPRATEFPVTDHARPSDGAIVCEQHPVSTQRIGMGQLAHFKQSQPETGTNIRASASVVSRIIDKKTIQG